MRSRLSEGQRFLVLCLLVGLLCGVATPIQITPDCSIHDAAQKMIHHNLQQIPVVDTTHPARLVGWLTLNDIARQQNAM
ncbi:MAG: CBS domain-containing protein [Luteolibacter sp.]